MAQKRKRNREGYEEGTTIFFKATPVVTFVQSPDPVLALSSYSEFTFEGPESQVYVFGQGVRPRWSRN